MDKGINRCECVVCGDKNVKRINCRIFSLDALRVNREKVGQVFGNRCFDEDKILYICNRCTQDIKNVGKKQLTIQKETEFLCTCSHEMFEERKKVFLFDKKKYDFTHHTVVQALAKSVRRKLKRNEYICKECHGMLNRKTKCVEPQMPPNAKCLNTKSSKSENSYNVWRVDYAAVLKRYQKSKDFDELTTEVKKCIVNPNVKVSFNRIMTTDKIDRLAQEMIPSDYSEKVDACAVATSPDGSCFFNALSRLCFGNESRATELRVLTINEAVMNKEKYLDHDYLCRGFDSPHPDDVHLADVYKSYGSDQLQDCNREDFYKGEVMELRGSNAYCGVWQFHQAAAVLNKPIQGVFPVCGINSLRRDMNRVFLPPKEKKGDSCVTVMWTKTSPALVACNHFVALVRYAV